MLRDIALACEGDRQLVAHALALRVPMSAQSIVPRHEVETRMVTWMGTEEGVEVSLRMVKQCLTTRKNLFKAIEREPDPSSRSRRQGAASSSSSDTEMSSSGSEESDEWAGFRILM